MKVKLKLDLSAAGGFLIRNVEKFVFAMVAAGLLFFVAGALRYEAFDRSPDDLARLASDANQTIESTQAPDAGDLDPPYIERAKREPIKADLYGLTRIWTPTIWEEQVQRGEPTFLPVQQLRAAAGHGAINMIDPVSPGATVINRSVRGQRWVLLTGLIPIQAMEDAYFECFHNAQSQDVVKDRPQVVWYKVERAELASPTGAGQLVWNTLNVLQALSVQSRWVGVPREIVPTAYLHPPAGTRFLNPLLPLPPLVDRSWGAEVAHEPEITLTAPTTLGGFPGSDEDEEDEDEDNEDGGRPSGLAFDPSNMADGPMVAPSRTTLNMATQEVAVKKYELFRFFDFAVQPGKHYRYRVSLQLLNPNYGVDPRFLMDESLCKEQLCTTSWSDPSELISVPHDAEVLLGSVKPAVSLNTEPKATVGIPFFYEKTGASLFEEMEVFRGQLLNFYDRPAPLSRSQSSMGRGGFGSDEEEDEEEEEEEEEEEDDEGRRPRRPRLVRGAAARRPPAAAGVSAEKVNFLTESILLDIAGGKTLPGTDRDLSDPGRLLLLDPYGNLVVRDELADLTEFLAHLEPQAATGPSGRFNDEEEDEDEEEEEEDEDD